MKDEASKLAAKIAQAKAAHGSGALASHSVAKAIQPKDSDISGRWGPAMRR